MSTPRLYWDNFETKDDSFVDIIQKVKDPEHSEHREFELRFGIPKKSYYDGSYEFNSDLGKALFDKYKNMLDAFKEPKQIKPVITRKSIRLGNEFVTARNVDVFIQ